MNIDKEITLVRHIADNKFMFIDNPTHDLYIGHDRDHYPTLLLLEAVKQAVSLHVSKGVKTDKKGIGVSANIEFKNFANREDTFIDIHVESKQRIMCVSFKIYNSSGTVSKGTMSLRIVSSKVYNKLRS